MRPSTDRHALAAAIALVAASPVATWWVVGDLSETVSDPDYLFRPVELPRAAELALGLGSLALVIAGAAVIVRLLYRRELDRKWLPPIVFLFAAGVVIGFSWRVVTAGVIGANIGGGLVLLFGIPLVIALVVAAVVSAMLGPVNRRHG